MEGKYNLMERNDGYKFERNYGKYRPIVRISYIFINY